MYQYPGIFHQGIFLARPNRFIAEVQIHSEVVVCHVKNTGRMTELLVPGRTCYIMEALNPNRKTKYDLIAVEYEDTIVNLDSQVPNKVVEDAFLEGQIRSYEEATGVRREVTVGDSRLDMVVELGGRKLYVEVKGVDLLLGDGLAAFPDAPTTRGTKHLLSLKQLVEEGNEAMALFLIQREDVTSFRPYYERDPLFAKTFYEVVDAGVQARAYTCKVGPAYIDFGHEVEILGI